MATPISTVIDSALVSIQDYKIDKLYKTSRQQWQNYMCGFLNKAIADFYNCSKSLSVVGTNFTADLSAIEISILAQWVVYEWLTREINNVTQIHASLTDNDFKRHSEAQNLKEKTEYQDRIREKVRQNMVDYSIQKVNWGDWANGNFGI